MDDGDKKKGKLISEFTAGFMTGNWAAAIAFILIKFLIRCIGD